MAIIARHRISFVYRKIRWMAEPHLLGHARRTHAFVLCAWAIEPREGIEYFRFAEMRDVNVLFQESFAGARRAFNPRDRKFVAVDTLIQPAR